MMFEVIVCTESAVVVYILLFKMLLHHSIGVDTFPAYVSAELRIFPTMHSFMLFLCQFRACTQLLKLYIHPNKNNIEMVAHE